MTICKTLQHASNVLVETYFRHIVDTIKGIIQLKVVILTEALFDSSVPVRGQ